MSAKCFTTMSLLLISILIEISFSMLAFLGCRSSIRLFISCGVVSSDTNLSVMLTFFYICKIL